MSAHTDTPLDVLLASPGLSHDGGTLATRSLGGSETAAILVGKALAARGHHVTTFSPGHTGGSWDGVQYLPLESFTQYAAGTPHDVTIVSRAMDLFRFRLAGKVQILWCHDLALKRNQGTLGGVVWSVDAVYVLSEFHRRQYVEVNGGLSPQTYVVTRNGLDLARFSGLADLPRDPTKLVYGSRPERGLENALAIMELLAAAGSPLVLHVSWYDNTPEHLVGYYNALWARAQAAPNVKLLGPLKQADWHRELATARAMVLPGCAGDFREISCLLLAEAQACGTPVVSCAKGALPETLAPDAGVLLGDDDTDVTQPQFRQQFADTVVDVATKGDRWLHMHKAGLARAATLDWAGVAEQWERHWLSVLDQRASNPERMTRHFARIGEREVSAC